MRIFNGIEPQSAHEQMEYERLLKETLAHHQNGTADTPEGQKAFAEMRALSDKRGNIILSAEMFPK